VVHAGVLHAEHGRVLGLLEAAGDDLADEERVLAEVDGLAHLAVEPGGRLVEDRRAGGLGVEREAVGRARALGAAGVRLDLDRLWGLADNGPALPGAGWQAETALS